MAELVSTNLIILISAWPKLPISLQASSGVALRSPAALISLPRFSASSRNGTKLFMQSSGGPPACEGGAGPRSNAAPESGAAPVDGNATGAPPRAAGAAPFTGGNGEALLGAAWPGSGAGNAPCAKPWPAWQVTRATVSGTIKRRMIKAVPPARSNGPNVFRSKSDFEWAFYDSCRLSTTRRFWQQRGVEPRRTAIIAVNSATLG